MIEKSFRVGTAIYALKFEISDDSRHLVDEKNDLLLIIEHSLKVRDFNGTVGNLCSEGDKWIFYTNPLRTRIDTGVAVNDHCLHKLLEAEEAVCKHYIESLTPAASAASN